MRARACRLAPILALLASAHSSDAATVAGRVVGWDDDPIAGAEVMVSAGPTPVVTWREDDAPLVYARATTDASGAFAIDSSGVPPGAYVLLVRPPGRPTLAIERLRWAFGAEPLPHDAVLRIPPPVSCDGIVLDEDGTPVPGVLVHARALGSAVSARAQARSGSDGRFAIHGLPLLSRVLLDARTPSFEGLSDFVVLEPVGTRHAVIVTQRRSAPSGPMSDGTDLLVVADGAPAVGARVTWGDEARSEVAGADGRVRGPRTRTSQAPVSVTWRGVTQWLQPDSDVVRIPTGARVRGRVVSTLGKPAAGVMVLVGSRTAVVTATRSDGTFAAATIGDGDPVAIALSGTLAGCAQARPGHAVRVELAPCADISVDAPGITAGSLVYAASMSWPLPPAMGACARDGVVTVRSLVPGPWRVHVFDPNGNTAMGVVLARASASIADVPIALRWPVRVRCVDDDGHPIEGAVVSTPWSSPTADPFGSPWSVATGRDGFAQGAVEPAWIQGCEPQSSSREAWQRPALATHVSHVSASPVLPPSRETRTIVLPRGATIRGVVTAPEGMPVASALVRDRGDEFHAFTDAHGRFETRHVPAASYEVSACAPEWGESADVIVEAKTDGTAEVALRLTPPRIVTVTVTRNDGTPAGRTSVDISGSGPCYFDQAPKTTGEDGTVEAIVGNGSWSASVGWVDVRATADQTTAALTIEPTGRISGRVTRAGRPVLGAYVDCGGRATSGPDGEFTIEARLGTQECTAEFGDSVAKTPDIRVRAGAERRVTFRLHDLRWRAIDVVTTDGAPMPGMPVWVHGLSPSPHLTDASGRAYARMDDSSGASTWLPGIGSGVEQSPEALGPLRFMLPLMLVVRGRITDARGNGAFDVDTELTIDGKPDWTDIEVDPEGHFAFRCPVGRARLLAWRQAVGAEELAVADFDVTREGAGPIELVIVPQSNGTVRVQIDGAQPGDEVWLESLAPDARTPPEMPHGGTLTAHRMLDDRNVATFEHVAAGAATVRFHGLAVPIDVRPQGTTEVTLDVPH